MGKIISEDLKDVGRSWRDVGEESGEREEGRRKDKRKGRRGGQNLMGPTREKIKEKIQARHCSFPGDQEVPEVHGLPDLKTALHMMGVGNYRRMHVW